jgi:hypothetical protein
LHIYKDEAKPCSSTTCHACRGTTISC